MNPNNIISNTCLLHDNNSESIKYHPLLILKSSLNKKYMYNMLTLTYKLLFSNSLVSSYNFIIQHLILYLLWRYCQNPVILIL